MAELKKIGSFQTFSEMKSEQTKTKLAEEQSIKREQIKAKFATILDELNVDNIEIESIEEGNAFVYAAAKAKKEGKTEFEFNGKTFKVTLKSALLKESVNEAIKVEGKRDAKKVVTQYTKIFNKVLVDFGAMSNESILGCIKYLMFEAMGDANFHREALPTSKMIKGNIKPLEIKMPGLGGHFVKIGPSTIKSILDKYYSDIANAAGWSGQGIVEGTALYLEQLKQEAMGQAVINKFNAAFEGEDVRIDLDSKLNESNEVELITVTDEATKLEEGNAFGAARSKAIADGNDEFTVDGETFKVEDVDGEDKENAEEFVSESSKEEQIAMELYTNLVSAKHTEHTEDSLSKSSSSDFLELIKLNGHNGSKAKKIATEFEKIATMESVVTEAEVKSDEEFAEYANTVLQKAFGEDFDEAKAKEVIDGILSKCDGDYGAAVGMLTSSLGESNVTESIECSNKKGHSYKEIDKDGTVECEHCGLRNSLSEKVEGTVYEATVIMDAVDPKAKSLKKLLKKYNVTMKVINKSGPGGGWPEVEMTGSVEDLTAVLADPTGWDDEELAEYIEESNVTEQNEDGTISDDEDDDMANLFADVEFSTNELINLIDKETENIGGSFRAPGYAAQCRKVVKQIMKDKKFKL